MTIKPDLSCSTLFERVNTQSDTDYEGQKSPHDNAVKEANYSTCVDIRK